MSQLSTYPTSATYPVMGQGEVLMNPTVLGQSRFEDKAYFEQGIVRIQPPVSITTATATLTYATSGGTYILNKADGITVTLPAAANVPGVTYKFIVGTAPTTDIDITPAEQTIYG